MDACDIDTGGSVSWHGKCLSRGQRQRLLLMVRFNARMSHSRLGRVVRYGLVVITGLGVLAACDPRRAQSDLVWAGHAVTRLAPSCR